jgi:hypothetical protein
MANWCINWFTIEVDKANPECDKFFQDLHRYQTLNDHRDQKHNQGTRFFDEAIFYLTIDDVIQGETVIGNFSTKWFPLGLDLFKKICKSYPAIKSIECNFEEFGCNVAGRITAARDGGYILVTNHEAIEEFWDVLNIRDSAHDLKDGYESLEQCEEITGLDKKQIEKALSLCNYRLDDFNSNCELPDPMDHLEIVE